MKAEELITECRFQLNDTDKIEFSDGELLSYLNQALRYINNFGINLNSKLFLKRADLTLNNGVALLPADFVREKSVKTGSMTLKSGKDYNIIGNEIYAKSDTITLEYFYQITHLSSLAEDIPLRNIFVNVLKQMIIYFALNRTNVNAKLEIELGELYKRELENIFKLYGNTRLDRKLPFIL